jgi:hypothetical protein
VIINGYLIWASSTNLKWRRYNGLEKRDLIITIAEIAKIDDSGTVYHR